MDLHFEENNNQSLKRFEKMLRTDNVYFFDSAEFERIIHYYIDNGKVNLAKKAISLGLEQHPDTVGLRLLQAELLIIEGNFDDAYQLLVELEALEPSNTEVYIQKGMLLSKQEKHEEAIVLLEQALSMTEEATIDILSLIAMEYLFLENFERALLYFRNCLEIDANDVTTLYNVIYCYDMLDKPDDAIDFLKKYVDNYPYSEVAWHQLGRQYAIKEQHVEALKAYDYAILIDEKFVGAYIEKAKSLEVLEYYEEAIVNYLMTTEIDDPSAFAYLRIGFCYEQLNKNDKAIEYYLLSNEQDPYLDKPLLALADLHFKTKEFQRAIYYVNQLINIDEDNPKFWKIYAHSNLKIAFFEEAAKAFKRCLELDDNSLEIHVSLADAYYYLGDYQEALKVLLNAEIYYHRHADIEYRLAGLNFLAQNTAQGVRHLQMALHINASMYKDFQKLFPRVHHSVTVRAILENFRNSNSI